MNRAERLARLEAMNPSADELSRSRVAAAAFAELSGKLDVVATRKASGLLTAADAELIDELSRRHA